MTYSKSTGDEIIFQIKIALSSEHSGSATTTVEVSSNDQVALDKHRP